MIVYIHCPYADKHMYCIQQLNFEKKERKNKKQCWCFTCICISNIMRCFQASTTTIPQIQRKKEKKEKKKTSIPNPYLQRRNKTRTKKRKRKLEIITIKEKSKRTQNNYRVENCAVVTYPPYVPPPTPGVGVPGVLPPPPLVRKCEGNVGGTKLVPAICPLGQAPCC